ncbi:hypothetical protein SETIT_9G233300v2 [Setaria italica]|uniref:F-box domain-containing protein n=1 Tax=Setaria italica TaxID=4555 RepID=A0A368SLI2_SETIT|nr:hypothetical protein SETIT_9G233300v2 [Setaria italica]
MEPSVGSHGGDLPDDVLRQIFVRLPLRDVCRFRAACRSWRAVASEPDLLRAHARRRRRASRHLGPLLTIDDNAASGHGGCNTVRIALPGRWSSTIVTRSWDGILCVELAPYLYALVNPLSGACTVVPAPTPRGREPRCFVRGYIAGAYSHPVTGIFHLLHCTSLSQLATGDDAYAPRTICFRLLRVDGTSASAWREIPMSADPDTATLQTIAGHNFCASSATVNGRLHWRDTLRGSSSAVYGRHRLHLWDKLRGQEKPLVFDTVKEEFGSMPLPQTVTTMSGKLCLLLGLVERRARPVEVWVLEDYGAQDQWWLRQRFDAAVGTPLHAIVYPSSYLGNVGLITAEDRVEKIVFWNGWRKQVYDVRRESLSESKLEFRRGTVIHTESPVPHDVVFGAAPTQGVALSSLDSSQSQQRRRKTETPASTQ